MWGISTNTSLPCPTVGMGDKECHSTQLAASEEIIPKTSLQPSKYPQIFALSFFPYNSCIEDLSSYFDVLKGHLTPLFCPPSWGFKQNWGQQSPALTSSYPNVTLHSYSLYSTLWSASPVWMSDSSGQHFPPQPPLLPIVSPCRTSYLWKYPTLLSVYPIAMSPFFAAYCFFFSVLF